MENEKQINTGDWVDDRMAELEPAGSWQPNAERALARVRERSRKAAARRRAWGWATAAASTLCVVVLAVPVTRAAVFRACTAACAVVWPSVLAEESQDLAAAAGGEFDSASQDFRLAPDFALLDADGREIKLSDFKGKVVLLNFWATWCPPCKVEMPWFVEFQRKYKDRGFSVVAVSLDEGWAAVKPYAVDLKPNFPIVIGSDQLAERFGGISALPETFLIDREGNIRSKHAGLVSPSEYEERIEKLLGGATGEL